MSDQDLINQLVFIRRARGLSGKDMAERMCCTRANISQIERGHRSPTLATLRRYADAVGAVLEVKAS